jgi:putative addiction module killer protein
MVTELLPYSMIEIREYIDVLGINHFGKWFKNLNAPASARVVKYLARIEQGNFSTVKSVGQGVFETKIDFGPGYRVYFGKDGEQLVILLGGGTKKRQQQDIQKAHLLWQECKSRKVGGNS